MVDPVSLSVGAVAAAVVAKAVDKTAEAAVDSGAGAIGRLLGWLRARFAGDADAEAALAKVEEVPDSARLQAALAGEIDRRAGTDPTFASELAQLLEQAKAEVDVGAITQIATGNQSVQNAGVADSTITVTCGSPPPSR